ncbi:MAG: heme-copper oxidase subunit III [Planctomycetaceae bacterium]
MSISPIARPRSLLARRFFVLSSGLLALAVMIAISGIHWSSRTPSERSIMPSAFWISSAFLIAGSVTLQRAAWLVRVQRLESFRRWLIVSLISGTLFVGVQICGLWRLAQNQTRPGQSLPDSAETGANALVAMFAGLHGVHFVIALLFVAWITVNAFANRYDHEYSSGVTFCAWFWHTLGIVWLMILGLFAAGALTGFEATSVPDPQVSVRQIIPSPFGRRWPKAG